MTDNIDEVLDEIECPKSKTGIHMMVYYRGNMFCIECGYVLQKAGRHE